MIGLRGSRKRATERIERRESREEDAAKTLYSHIHQGE
jgi:hypothetical protein